MAAIELDVPRISGRRTDALTRIETHEAVCAERWKEIVRRMDRLERLVAGAAGTLIVGMAGLIVTLLFRTPVYH